MNSERSESQADLDAVVVGAGFAGLYMLYRLREAGLRVRVFEKGADVGGTWYWNRYPGARCDVESIEYSYQFLPDLQQEWDWSERFATQPEILRYLNHVAECFELRPQIQFSTEVKSAHYDEKSALWQLNAGEKTLSCRFLIMATGCLSVPYYPEIPGRNSFAGNIYHTGEWPHQPVDFTGKRVAVLGTGSSGVQAIPMIAEQARSLEVFQRSPSYTVPARNAPLSEECRAEVKANYDAFRAQNWTHFGGLHLERREVSALEVSEREREREFESRWQFGGPAFQGAFADVFYDHKANQYAADFIAGKIREIVKDPQVAELLLPDDPVGCKRITVGTDYYETYNRDNVRLRDAKSSPIEAITPEGIVQDGELVPLDAIVFATGFDAMTGALLKMDIRGRGGVTLKEKWRDGPKTLLGLGISEFPNLFTITGPCSPSVFSNMVISIEQHVNWISDCISYIIDNGYRAIEARPDAESQWVEQVFSLAEGTVLLSCNSWYLGANIPGKSRVFSVYLDFAGYVETCAEVAREDYRGFTLT